MISLHSILLHPSARTESGYCPFMHLDVCAILVIHTNMPFTLKELCRGIYQIYLKDKQREIQECFYIFQSGLNQYRLLRLVII